jgi:hypothetical protein
VKILPCSAVERLKSGMKQGENQTEIERTKLIKEYKLMNLISKLAEKKTYSTESLT